MTEPYLGEIRMAGFNFAPAGWSFCDGSLLPISQNSALFALITTTYGGDGKVSFALPELRGRVPIHVGNGHALAERGGVETVALAANEMPTHTHAVSASSGPAATVKAQEGGVPAVTGAPVYVASSASALVPLAASAITATGGGAVHTNLMPFQVVGFIIALAGVYPSVT